MATTTTNLISPIKPANKDNKDTTGTTATEFPSFPSPFGKKEQERLDKLSKQRTEMTNIYQQKFSTEAWAKTPAVEKLGRTLVANAGWLIKPIQWITPASWGFDYGATPEQAQQQIDAISSEYKELVRRQRINSILPDIKQTLIAAALAGSPVMSLSKVIPDAYDTDFNEDDKAYLANLAAKIANASREELLSGQFDTELTPTTKPPDFSGIFADMPELTPQQILSTVAFSSDVANISDALKYAYPPSYYGRQPVETNIPEVTQEESLDFLKKKADALGIPYTDDTSASDLSASITSNLLKNKNTIRILTNSETGEMLPTIEHEDGSIWYGDTFLGYVENDTLVMGEKIESSWKNAFDALRLSLVNTTQSFTEYFLSSLPQEIFKVQNKTELVGNAASLETYNKQLEDLKSSYADRLSALGLSEDALDNQSKYSKNTAANDLFKEFNTKKQELMKANKVSELVGTGLATMLSDSQLESVNNWFAQIRGFFKQAYDGAVTQHEEWLKDHTNLMPNANWEDGKPHFNEPAWYAYVIFKNCVPTIASVVVGSSVFAATKNPALSLASSFALMNPLNTQDAYNDFLESGASVEEAARMANSVGAIISTIDVGGDIPAMKIGSSVMLKVFKKDLTKELVDLTVKNLLAKGLTTFTEQEVSEVASEVLQQAIQNASARTFDPSRKISEGLWQVAYETAISVAPMAAFGSGSDVITDLRSRLSPASQSKIQEDINKYTDAGVNPAKAEQIALANFMETTEGNTEVEAAMQERNTEIPELSSKAIAKIADLESSLDSINQEIDTVNKSIAIQQDRLAKMYPETSNFMEIPEHNEAISNLKSYLDELTSKRDGILDTIHNIKEDVKYKQKIDTLKDKKASIAENIQPTKQEETSATRLSAMLPKFDWDSLNDEDKAYLISEAKLPAKTILKKWADIPKTKQNAILSKMASIKSTMSADMWNKLSKQDKTNLAIKAGIAKTAANKVWTDLTDVQQQKIQDVSTVEATYRRIGDYEVMLDKDGRLVICG